MKLQFAGIFASENNSILEDVSLFSGTKKLLSNILYIVSLIVTTVLAYWYIIVYHPVSGDALSIDRYIHGVLIGQGRLTQTIVGQIINLESNNFALYDTIGLVLFLMAMLVMGVILDSIIRPKNLLPIIIFSCLCITYPLMYEYFIFGGCLLATGGATLFVNLALYFSLKKRRKLYHLILSIVLIMFALSWYESFVLVYICVLCLVLILWYYKNPNLENKSKRIFNILLFQAIIVLFAIILNYITVEIIQIIFSIPSNSFAAKGSAWGEFNTLSESFRFLLSSIVKDSVSKVFCYFPFTVLYIAYFVLLVIIIIDLIKHKDFMLLVIELGMFATTIMFTVYMGFVPPYRIEMAWGPFVSGVFLLALIKIINLDKKTLTNIAYMLLVAAIAGQCVSLNISERNENARYVNEASVIENINENRIIKENTDKPVVLIGRYQISDEVNKRFLIKKNSVAYKIYDFGVGISNINDTNEEYRKYYSIGKSYLAWGIDAFSEANTENYKFAEYLGYSITPTPCTVEQYIEANKKYADIPSYPNDGYIVEDNEYVVVKLGNVIDYDK